MCVRCDDGVFPLNYHESVVAKHRFSNEVVSESIVSLVRETNNNASLRISFAASRRMR